jgi:hypothetical protein
MGKLASVRMKGGRGRGGALRPARRGLIRGPRRVGARSDGWSSHSTLGFHPVPEPTRPERRHLDAGDDGRRNTRGASAPLGATVSRDGVNFSVFSRHAAGVELAFFSGVDDGRPARVVRLDPTTDRTYHYWHAFVPGVQPGQMYGTASRDPPRGLRFDPTKVLLDPYGRGVAVPARYSREAALIEKIPYLKDLGVTALELLAIFQFDRRMLPRASSTTGATHRFRSSRRTRRTAHGRIRSAPSMSSGTWSRRCTGRASRSPRSFAYALSLARAATDHGDWVQDPRPLSRQISRATIRRRSAEKTPSTTTNSPWRSPR